MENQREAQAAGSEIKISEAKGSETKGYILMIIATLFWGMMGINSRFLNEVHMNSMDISLLRCVLAAICATVYCAFANRNAFKVDFKGLLFSFFYGILLFGIGFALYGIAVERIPIAVATVLMFSNPIWVTFFGKIFFKDTIGLKKAITISICIVGCMCIIDIFTAAGSHLDAIGVLCGLGNGMTFGLQIVLPRFVHGKYGNDTLLLYGFWGATIFTLIFADPIKIVNQTVNAPNPGFVMFNLLAIGVLATYISNTFYVKSTVYLGTSKPSIMVALEPVFASILAFLIFGEMIKPIQIFGAVLVILSVVSMQINFAGILRKRHIAKNEGKR